MQKNSLCTETWSMYIKLDREGVYCGLDILGCSIERILHLTAQIMYRLVLPLMLEC
jgi:hypothetical protein